MPSADLTRRALSFGAADTITGWYARSYAETTITGCIQNKGSTFAGLYSKYPHTAYIPDVIREGDQIEDAQGVLYEINTVEQIWWLDQFIGYQCEAVKKQFPNRPDTSGTWHTDTDTISTDTRHRTKKYLDDNMDHNNIDGDYLVQFDGADYNVKYLFNSDLGVDTDAVILVGKNKKTPFITYQPQHATYGFQEQAVITIYAVNKSAITAPNIIEQIEKEIEDVVTDHPVVEEKSQRALEVTNQTREALGDNSYLWGTVMTLTYIRDNDDYTNSGVTLTYGDNQGSTYTIPNITSLMKSTEVYTTRLQISSRMGNAIQKMGMPDYQITMKCDLRFGAWKRALDTTEEQVFLDVQFNGQNDSDQLYQELDLGLGGVCNVTVERVEREGETLTVTFNGYSATAPTDYAVWLGLDT